jgi:hypothetical protein
VSSPTNITSPSSAGTRSISTTNETQNNGVVWSCTDRMVGAGGGTMENPPITWRRLPCIIAQSSCRKTVPTPLMNHILSAYKIKNQPRLIAYYHATAGFPTKPTWISAIKNGHYKSWKGLVAATVQRIYPELVETCRGHSREIQMKLRSTKQTLEEEEVNYIVQN